MGSRYHARVALIYAIETSLIVDGAAPEEIEIVSRRSGMGDGKLTVADYPLAEKRPELIAGRRGKTLADITLDAVVAGDVALEDLRITPEALQTAGGDSREAAGRPMLAENFERAAELVDVPQDFVMQVYELLRPGRAKDKAPLLERGERLARDFKAERMARFVEEAAEVYERRGLFTYRF